MKRLRNNSSIMQEKKENLSNEDMKIHILMKDKRWEKFPLKKICQRTLRLALVSTNGEIEKCGISVLASNDKEIANLNLKFRGFDKPTNILSWPEYDLKNDKPGALPKKLCKILESRGDELSLGNLALSFDTCQIEAENRLIKFKDHITHLLLHGCLHLLGFNHEEAQDAKRMEKIEINLLSSIGIKNPYQSKQCR